MDAAVVGWFEGGALYLRVFVGEGQHSGKGLHSLPWQCEGPLCCVEGAGLHLQMLGL